MAESADAFRTVPLGEIDLVRGRHMWTPSSVTLTATHALRLFDLTAGKTESHSVDGIATAAAVDGWTAAVVEEPIVYHDDGYRRGRYALHLDTV